MKRFIGFIFILSSLNVFSQNKMRPVDELINQKEPGWILVKEWIDSAKSKYFHVILQKQRKPYIKLR
jgi:hypothetical protein